MKIYHLAWVKRYRGSYKDGERTFLSHETALRYHRIIRSICSDGSLAAGISEIEVSTHGARVYVLTEENHGEIGYYLDRDKAYDAARDVIMENPYLMTWNGRGYDSREVTREEITDKQIDDDDFCVCVYKYKLNEVWC